MTHSTWEGEVRELKAQNRELALQAQAQLNLQEELMWQNIRAQQAVDEAKARRAENERLRRAVQAAITFLGAGTPETAKMVLEQALRGQE